MQQFFPSAHDDPLFFPEEHLEKCLNQKPDDLETLDSSCYESARENSAKSEVAPFVIMSHRISPPCPKISSNGLLQAIATVPFQELVFQITIPKDVLKFSTRFPRII